MTDRDPLTDEEILGIQMRMGAGRTTLTAREGTGLLHSIANRCDQLQELLAECRLALLEARENIVDCTDNAYDMFVIQPDSLVGRIDTLLGKLP